MPILGQLAFGYRWRYFKIMYRFMIDGAMLIMLLIRLIAGLIVSRSNDRSCNGVVAGVVAGVVVHHHIKSLHREILHFLEHLILNSSWSIPFTNQCYHWKSLYLLSMKMSNIWLACHARHYTTPTPVTSFVIVRYYVVVYFVKRWWLECSAQIRHLFFPAVLPIMQATDLSKIVMIFCKKKRPFICRKN